MQRDGSVSGTVTNLVVSEAVVEDLELSRRQ